MILWKLNCFMKELCRQTPFALIILSFYVWSLHMCLLNQKYVGNDYQTLNSYGAELNGHWISSDSRVLAER